MAGGRPPYGRAPRSHQTIPARPRNKRLIGNRSHLGPGTTGYIVEIQGANVLSEHFQIMAALWPSFAEQILNVTADIAIEHARELVPVDTGATRDSINSNPGVWVKPDGEWSIRFGPTTFYSPFLEYGTRFMTPRSFMIPAGDLAEYVLTFSVMGFINLLNTDNGGMGFGSGNVYSNRALSDPRIKSPFTSSRTWLYSTAKALGDVAVFGGREFIGPVRASMYRLARGMGDVSSIMTRTLNTRVTNRLRGRVTGRIVGFGSASLSFGKTFSAFPGGSAGHRVYQRVAGRYGTIGFNPESFRSFLP